MNRLRLISSSLRVMQRYKVRSVFMMLGSLVGVAALILVISIGTGAEQKILRTVRGMFSASSALITSGGGMILGGPRADGARLTLEDMEAVAAEVPTIESWDPVHVIPNSPIRRGDTSSVALVLGDSERFAKVWGRGLSHGDYFDANDVARSARVALIGKTVSRTHFGDQDPVGSELMIGTVGFRVIGVMASLGTDAHGMDRDNEIVIPISTAMRRLQNVDTIRGAKILAKTPEDVRQAAQDVRRILRERHNLAPGAPDDFTVLTPVEVQSMVGRVQQALFVFLPLIGGLCMLAGAIAAATLMLLAVNERRGEIGLRRAVGARPGDIALQFMCESVVTSLTGGMIGVGLGVAGAYGVARLIELSSFLSWKGVALGLALSIVAGVVAGVLPARRAAQLQPADALR